MISYKSKYLFSSAYPNEVGVEVVNIANRVDSMSEELAAFAKELLTFIKVEHDLPGDIAIFISSLGTRFSIMTKAASDASNEGATTLMDKDKFLSEYTGADVLTSSSKSSASIDTAKSPSKKVSFYKFLSTIPRSISSWFNGESLTGLDLDIFKDLALGDAQGALSKIQQYAKEKGLQDSAEFAVAKCLLTMTHEAVFKDYKRRIEENKKNIAEYMENINHRLKVIRDLKIENEEMSLYMDNLERKVSNEDIESTKAFLHTLTGVAIGEYEGKPDTVFVKLEQPLDQVDECLAAKYAESSETYGDLNKLIRALWIDKVAKIYTYSGFTLSGLVTSLLPSSQADALSQEFPNAIPHPHLVVYRCMGGYETSFVELATGGDLYSVIMTMIACARNFNLADSAVRGRFFAGVMRYSAKCCEYKGERLTPRELVAKLDSEAMNVEAH